MINVLAVGIVWFETPTQGSVPYQWQQDGA